MVTHDPRAAARAERVLHLDKGRLVDDVRTAGDAISGADHRDARPIETEVTAECIARPPSREAKRRSPMER